MRGSGQVSVKDIDKLNEVTRQVKQLKQESEKSSPDGSMNRTIEELERAVEKARKGGDESSDKQTPDGSRKAKRS